MPFSRFIEAHITLSRKYSIFSKISWLSTILYNSSSNYLYEITKHEKHSYIFLFIHILCVCFQFSFHFQKEVHTFSFKDEWACKSKAVLHNLTPYALKRKYIRPYRTNRLWQVQWHYTTQYSIGPRICVKYFLSFPQKNLSPEKTETN